MEVQANGFFPHSFSKERIKSNPRAKVNLTLEVDIPVSDVYIPIHLSELVYVWRHFHEFSFPMQ